MNRYGWMAVAAGMGMVAGMRGMTAPAAVSTALALRPRPLAHGVAEELLSSPRAAALLGALALGEALLDKAPFTPARTRAPLLAARAAGGALSATAIGTREAQHALPFAWIGALAAILGSFGFLALRRGVGARLGISDRWIGAAEDLIALLTASGLARKL